MKMGVILLVILVWVVAGLGVLIMKKIQPEDKLYPWYALAVCIALTGFVAWHVS